ncbi:MAG: hypothetical protein LBN95_12815 [Prevotellaceae bacterium]|jgi:ATP-dependent DNA helicase RecG|nr:hypothetical protein [Prevotellaceae bacterium]
MSIEYNKNKKYSKLELMEMAFQESLLSVSEHTDKPDPKVGAILTTADGKILATAHRGELRVGEHCEYTLIERKLQSENLQGCNLYVTLEPCTDESRKTPKRGCSTHITKARLGKVFIGIRDPNVDIENKGANFLISQGIEVEDFNPEIADKIRENLKDFINYQEEQKLIIQQKTEEKPVEYLKQSVLNTQISLFSSNAINTFIQYSKAEFSYPSPEFNDWAFAFGLLTKDKNELIPTHLGLLLFGENILQHSIFKVEIDYGNGNTEIKDFESPVATQLPRIIDFVKDKALKLTIDRSSAKRETTADFPVEILREVIANAIIHRDYSIENSTNYLYIGADKIIVRSPGMPVPPLTVEEMQTFDIPSISRNPKIMYVYNRMGMAEQRGIGLRNLKHLPEYGFIKPFIKLIANILEITIVRNIAILPELKENTAKLTQEEQNGLLFIEQKGKISVKNYAEHFGLTEKTAQRRVKDLLDKKLIETVGENRWIKYKLKE